MNLSKSEGLVYGQTLKNAFPLLLLIFLLIFPKGGIKIADIPITWGYLLLFLACLPIFFRKTHTILRSHFQIFLALIPFQFVSLATFLMLGIEDVGFGVSFIIHFVLFPIIFFLVFSKSISEINLPVFLKYLKNGVFAVAIYGIFLFLFVHTFGFFFTIPFLTINWNDLGVLETTKCIVRGDFYKLISTYNNGNLYGICLLILLPLYLHLEKRSWKRSVVKLSLLLTLSRTVWFGLLIAELFRILYIEKINKKNIFKLIFSTSVFVIMLSLIISLLNTGISFILDPTLGGRYLEFYDLEDFYWVGRSSFNFLSEIVYLSIYKNFGIFGFITFLFGITSPLWMYYFSPSNKSTTSEPFQRSIFAGLSTYLIVSCSDGAVLLIPVMAFYWFLSALLLRCTNFPDGKLHMKN